MTWPQILFILYAIFFVSKLFTTWAFYHRRQKYMNIEESKYTKLFGALSDHDIMIFQLIYYLFIIALFLIVIF